MELKDPIPGVKRSPDADRNRSLVHANNARSHCSAVTTRAGRSASPTRPSVRPVQSNDIPLRSLLLSRLESDAR